jgi:hypothetical protein
MTLTREQFEAMLEAAKPLLKWMNENCHPECSFRVTTSHVELSENIAGCPAESIMRD